MDIPSMMETYPTLSHMTATHADKVGANESRFQNALSKSTLILVSVYRAILLAPSLQAFMENTTHCASLIHTQTC